MKRWLQLAVIAGFMLALVAPAAAGECEGVKFADSKKVAGKTLQLNGMGIREATMFKVDVYVAGLYVEKKSKSGKALANPSTAKRLELKFVRDVDKDDIVDAYSESFKKSAGGAYSKHASDLKKLLGWMSAIEEGESMIYTYVPGKGLEIEVAGKTKGTIKGKDFARIFFGIWLGDSPPNSGLKTGLLGGECG